MEYFDPDRAGTAVGLAHSPYVAELVERLPGALDYVEIPFEQLRHAPATADIQRQIPLVLHCASMSVGGFVPPEESTLEAIEQWRQRTRTLDRRAPRLHPGRGRRAGRRGRRPHLAQLHGLPAAERTDPRAGPRQPQAPPGPLPRADHPGEPAPVLPGAGQHDVAGRLHQSPVRAQRPAGPAAGPHALPDLRHQHGLRRRSRAGTAPAGAGGGVPPLRAEEAVRDRLGRPRAAGPRAGLRAAGQAVRQARPRAVTFEYNWAPEAPELSLLQQQFRRVRDLVEA